MKKNTYTLLGIITTIAMLCGIAVAASPTVTVKAVSKDVTEEMSQDKDLKDVCQIVTAYTTAMELSEDPDGEKSEEMTTVELNNANCLSIAAFTRFNEQEDMGYTEKELKETTKDLFGSAAMVSEKYIKEIGKTDMLVCISDGEYVSEPYMYCGGEFGDMIPCFEIQNITETGKQTYEITAENQIGVYGEEGSEKVGTTVFTVKKTPEKGYGYVIKEIAYQ